MVIDDKCTCFNMVVGIPYTVYYQVPIESQLFIKGGSVARDQLG